MLKMSARRFLGGAASGSSRTPRTQAHVAGSPDQSATARRAADCSWQSLPVAERRSLRRNAHAVVDLPIGERRSDHKAQPAAGSPRGDLLHRARASPVRPLRSRPFVHLRDTRHESSRRGRFAVRCLVDPKQQERPALGVSSGPARIEDRRSPPHTPVHAVERQEHQVIVQWRDFADRVQRACAPRSPGLRRRNWPSVGEIQSTVAHHEFCAAQADDAAIGQALVEAGPQPDRRRPRAWRAADCARRTASGGRPPRPDGVGAAASMPRRRTNCSATDPVGSREAVDRACAAPVSCIRLLPVGRLLPLSQRAASDLSTPTCWASFARLQLSRLASSASLAAKSSTSTDFGIATRRRGFRSVFACGHL